MIGVVAFFVLLLGCFQEETVGRILGNDKTNPIVAVLIGMQSTVLLQSSSTTVSIAVSLVGTGKIASQQAIYMIMGANIGTSVTSTLVALGKRGGGKWTRQCAPKQDVFFVSADST